MPSLIIIRGLPGSGKSSLAKLLSENKWPVFSIDDYFTNPETDVYEFKFNENHLAYKSCEERTAAAMKQGVEKIFLDNTFTLEWEMEPYFSLAKMYLYRVYVVTVENRHAGQNQHQITDEQIQKMADKYKVVLY